MAKKVIIAFWLWNSWGNLLKIFSENAKKRFSLKTLLYLVEQMVESVQLLHTMNLIHRDIKPENFVVGLGKKSSTVFLLDFGLTKLFRDPQSRLHIRYKEHKSFTGTARYASVNTHLGIEQSRRDDLESLGYLFVYFLKGSLPWQNLKAENKNEKYQQIMKMKLLLPIGKLCENLPTEFGIYLSYCRKMKFNQRPDYHFIENLFKSLFVKKGYKNDYLFDWIQPIVHKADTFSKGIDSIEKKPIISPKINTYIGEQHEIVSTVNSFQQEPGSTDVTSTPKIKGKEEEKIGTQLRRPKYVICIMSCILYTSPSPRDLSTSRMPSSA
eukprot:TRINITY_DN5045_c0_g1_i1.p1 TRINITY_DN5045_c0_g1~~TRINITY_DN5045_c0_g1_i1.p1  ORF type:complete len:325 (-),score=35.97 TRINITY_DN5045_c0_g1_i1:16-990(-)